ncbi:hypothetical protein HWV62_16984 [Athelia sp. TMB]|nr:hypothetical protein HWV62_16984 [Athelia sp. TMB]
MDTSFSDEHARNAINRDSATNLDDPCSFSKKDDKSIKWDVIIAGSGPIACAYARTILERNATAKVLMVEIGSQDSPVIGEHLKNSVKYQKDLDAFVNVVAGALQRVSVPVAASGVIRGTNPKQMEELNLGASAVTRMVGGMATHWTCACPTPHPDETVKNPIGDEELYKLLDRARKFLNVNSDQYDEKIPHELVKSTVTTALKEHYGLLKEPPTAVAIPLAVQRRDDNPSWVTWSGANTVLGAAVNSDYFRLRTETRVTNVEINGDEVTGVSLNYLNGPDCEVSVKARHPIKISLSPDITNGIQSHPLWPQWKPRVDAHHERYPDDKLDIPFDEPDPQVMIPYTRDFPFHCQVHRDAFAYGGVGQRTDPRLAVDLRFFSRQELNKESRVEFSPLPLPVESTPQLGPPYPWVPGVTDVYGMPQATFYVKPSKKDVEEAQRRAISFTIHKSLNLYDISNRMLAAMTLIAPYLGKYILGSTPMIMGTTRIGHVGEEETSVADPNSKVHHFKNLWVGGTGCIPDSTACNPTLTAVSAFLLLFRLNLE